MTKQKEIDILQSLKCDTYFAQFFGSNDIDQMCQNIKNDFGIECGCRFGPEANSLYTQQTNFKGFCAEEFPQRKALDRGIENLTTIELISLIIGTGTEKNVEQARRIYNAMNERVSNIAKSSIEDLQSIKGIGSAKAMAIKASIELGKRCYSEKMDDSLILGGPTEIFEFLYPMMSHIDVEEGHLLLLNRRLALVKHVRLSQGGLTETAIDVRVIIREALKVNATAVAIAHNHPSGILKPSKQDDQITKQVQEACKMMRLHFLDHIIVTDGGYYSYLDDGKI